MAFCAKIMVDRKQIGIIGKVHPSLYKEDIIGERHRHRFEYNNSYRKMLEEHGLMTTGINPELDLVEIVEVPKNDYFVACQFHPEFKSRPNRPGPVFDGLIRSAINKK